MDPCLTFSDFKKWGKFFVLNHQFDGRLFGKKGRVRLTLNVVPMGWLSAVGVIQYLRRQLVVLSAPRLVVLSLLLAAESKL